MFRKGINFIIIIFLKFEIKASLRMGFLHDFKFALSFITIVFGFIKVQQNSSLIAFIIVKVIIIDIAITYIINVTVIIIFLKSFFIILYKKSHFTHK